VVNCVFYNGSQVYTDLISTLVVYGGTSGLVNLPISGRVSSMQVQWGFTACGGNQAVGLGHFTTIPEPASILLLGLGGLALIRKHKS
jgi:hypothetical protein